MSYKSLRKLLTYPFIKKDWIQVLKKIEDKDSHANMSCQIQFNSCQKMASNSRWKNQLKVWKTLEKQRRYTKLTFEWTQRKEIPAQNMYLGKEILFTGSKKTPAPEKFARF